MLSNVKPVLNKRNIYFCRMLLEPSEIRKKQNGNGGEKKKRKLRKSE